MEVHSRRGNTGMAQRLLHQVDGSAPLQGMAGVGMAKPMGTNPLSYSRV